MSQTRQGSTFWAMNLAGICRHRHDDTAIDITHQFHNPLLLLLLLLTVPILGRRGSCG